MSARRRKEDASTARAGRVLRFVQRLPGRRAEIDPLHEADRPDAGYENRWHAGMKPRVILILAALGLWSAGVEGRLVYLQVFRHTAMLEEAKSEQEHTIHPVGVRGDIVDRHGHPFALSVPAASIAASPKEIKDPAATVEQLCSLLQDCTSSERQGWLTLILKEKPKGVEYARLRSLQAVTPEQTDRIAAFKRYDKKRATLAGIALVPGTERLYPNRELAAPVIGYVGTDNTGLAGLEISYDSVICGEPGTVRMVVDAHLASMDVHVDQEPTKGATIETTLDMGLQYIAERELAAGVANAAASSGMAAIIDPNNGEVLALANTPGFDANAFKKSSPDAMRNRPLTDVYEPGSTMKIVTGSAALQEHVASLSDTFDTDPGYLQIGSRKIHDADGHSNGVLSFTDVIVKSSNVGAGKIGLKIGPALLYKYVRNFGFGTAPFADLKGGAKGRVFGISELNDSATASMAIGYQISVTPVQMAMAASVVANGGTLYEAHLVRALIRDGVRQEIAPKAIRDVISPETAATMRSILEQVVVRGTGLKAALDGFVAAGKTGTAAKIVDHQYSTTDYNASFVGFVPSQHPLLTIIVVIDTPRRIGTHGGEVAAPVFKRIAEAALLQMHVLPMVATSTSISVVAPQPPATGASAIPAAIVLRPGDGAGQPMPDVRGLTTREAIRELNKVGVGTRFSGSGVVINQMPRAGDPVEAGSTATMQLGRPLPQAQPAETRTAVGGGV